MNFYDKLYLGFYMYGRNYYGQDYSVTYGEILLQICITVIVMPPLIYSTDFINSIISSVNPLYYLIGTYLLIIVCNICYFNINKRKIKIINYFKDSDKKTIIRMKRTSGYFALSSFGFLLIGMVYLFIISQEKRENRLKVDKQQREWQMQHKKQDSVKSIN